MIDYEGKEITRNFELWCGECDAVFDATITAYVWRDGSIYGDWHCVKCGAFTYSDEITKVSDLIDPDIREGK